MISRNEFLSKVYGYQGVKDELYEILGWYLNNELSEDKREFLPHGILFYGDPGQGKTLLMREFAKTFGYKIFVLEGDKENLDEVLVSTYKEAKKEEKGAIVIIDEIDRLIDKDSKLERVLQTELDGFKKEGNVLTLASANFYYDLPDSLVREGRFDRKYEIKVFNNKELKEIIKHFLKERDFLIEKSEDEVEELRQHLTNSSISKIKTLFNIVYFKKGKEAKLDDFINELTFIDTGCVESKEDFIVPRVIALHEAGHALYVYKFSKRKKFFRVKCYENRGFTYSTDIFEDNRETQIEDIQISLAGLVAEELFYKKHDIGCSNDLEKAYTSSFNLLNGVNINAIDFHAPKSLRYRGESISEYEKKTYAKRVNKFMMKNYHIVKRRLRKYKKELSIIADEVVKNKVVKREDLIRLIGK